MRKYLHWKNMDRNSKSRECVFVGQRENGLKRVEGKGVEGEKSEKLNNFM